MQELMCNFTHPATGVQYKLDANSGALYDLAGNPAGKLALKDDSKTLDRCRSVNASLVRGIYGRNGTINSALKDGRRTQAAFTGAISSGDTSYASMVLAARGFDEEKLATLDLAIGDVHQPAPLPNYSAGYKNEIPLADIYASPLLVEQISGKYYTWNSLDAFQEAVALPGAPSANVMRIQPRVSNATYVTTEWAIGSFVPQTLEAAADAALKVRMAAAKRVMNAQMLGRERRVMNLATTSSNWNSNNYVTLGAGFQWDGGASSDPVKDLQTRIEQSPMRPTGIIWNERVWHNFVRNPAVQKYFTYKSSVAPIPDPNQLAALLELPPIYVSRMRQVTSLTSRDVAGNFDYLWSDAAVLFRHSAQMPPVDQEDISTAITFRWSAALAAKAADVQSSSGGLIIREFYNQIEGTMGGTMIVVIMHDQEVQTSNIAGGLILGVTQ